MAIDTAAKRASVAGILTALTIVGITPNVAPDLAWRQGAGWGYEGISTLTAVEPSVVTILGGETFALPVHVQDAFALPSHGSDLLRLPVHAGDTLRC